MAENPKFVRLSDRASKGMLADIGGGGWAISGRDVLPFPERSDQKKFVRKHLNTGRLEVASLSEYEEARAESGEPQEEGLTHQEHRVHQKAKSNKSKGKKEKAEQVEDPEDSDDEGEASLSEDELTEMGADELKEILADKEIELDGRFSKAKAVEAILESQG